MNIDLSIEEMNLISSLIQQSPLTMNRESMVNFVNKTEVILQKFKIAFDASQQLKEGE